MEVRQLAAAFSLTTERACAAAEEEAAAAGPLSSTAGELGTTAARNTQPHRPLDDLDHPEKRLPTGGSKIPLHRDSLLQNDSSPSYFLYFDLLQPKQFPVLYRA